MVTCRSRRCPRFWSGNEHRGGLVGQRQTAARGQRRRVDGKLRLGRLQLQRMKVCTHRECSHHGAGFLETIHINLDFSGTDLANGTKVSDDIHQEAVPVRPIQADPPDFGGDRGEKRAVWQLSQFGRSTIWLRCRSWRSDCVQKNGDVGLATVPSYPHGLWRP